MSFHRTGPSIFDDPPAAPDEQAQNTAFAAWRTSPTPQARATLLRTVAPVIDTALQSYGGGAAGPSLRSRAKVMAARAFDTYDPARGTLKTHLLSQLQGLRRVAAQSQNPIRLPEQVALDRLWLDQTSRELADELGREPSDNELADRTGLSLKRLAYVRTAKPAATTGSFTDEEGDTYAPASAIPGAQDAERAWEDFVYVDLDPISQVIMDHTIGRNGRPRLSTAQLAVRLNISPSAVSQRKTRIQRMLDAQHEARLF